MTWLHCTTPRSAPAPRLVCFPHAGGVASFFLRWGPLCPSTEVHAVCYPGRAHRAAEPFATDLRRLAADIARAVRPFADDRPLALFGHSMGAWVAYETARSLQRDGIPISHLIVSGARGPQTLTGALTRPAPRAEAAIIDDLVALGGVPAELSTQPALLRRVFPYVVADVHMVDDHAHRPGPPLDCAVTAVVAVDDPVVTPREAEEWAQLTRGEFRLHTVPGNHFYLATEPPIALVEGLLASPVPEIIP